MRAWEERSLHAKEADLRSYTRLHDEALPPLGFLRGVLGSDTDSCDCAYIHHSCQRCLGFRVVDRLKSCVRRQQATINFLEAQAKGTVRPAVAIPNPGHILLALSLHFLERNHLHPKLIELRSCLCHSATVTLPKRLIKPYKALHPRPNS